MDDMPRKLPKYVYSERTRHKKVVFYFRIGKGQRIRLPAPNSPEFEDAYKVALTGSEPQKRANAKSGSIAWLVREYMASSTFAEYSSGTRKQRSYIYSEITKDAGDKPFKGITKKTILNGKEKRMDRPNQARMFLDAMRGLFKWATERGYVATNPSEGIANPKRTNSIGFEPWTEEDVDIFETAYPEGTKERVWLHVLLYIGLRKGDAVKAGKQHVKEGIFSMAAEKTGTQIYRAMHPQLIHTLSVGPVGDLHFVVGANGAPLNKDTFGNYFRRAAQKVGIHKPMHGIRKLSATIAAEQGLTVSELEALFGWTGGGMAQHYTKSASRKRLAMSAAEKMQNKESPHLKSKTPHLKNKG